MDISVAQKLLKQFGFNDNTVEPILCEHESSVGLFVTLKTKYGHLSRFLPFETEQELKDFLHVYSWYRKRIKNDDMIVSFDEYETLSPTVNFIYKDQILSVTNVYTIERLEQPIEQLEIDTPQDENLKLLEIVIGDIRGFYIEIDEAYEHANRVFLKYKNTLKDYIQIVKKRKQFEDIEIKQIDKNEIENKILEIKGNAINADEYQFLDFLQQMVALLQEVKCHPIYLEYLYIIEYYQDVTEKLINIINNYEQEKEPNKLFRKNNPAIVLEESNINKEEIIEKRKIQVENELISYKTHSLEELKVLHGIKEAVYKAPVTFEQKEKLNSKDLNDYFSSLSNEEKRVALTFSSPLKELFNLLYHYKDEENIYSALLNDKQYKETYQILSHQDSYVVAKKYFPFLQLDSLEEFIDSMISFYKTISLKPYILPFETEISFKVSEEMNQGLINASIENNFPTNNKGNNYCITTLPKSVGVFYSPYHLWINTDNILMVEENNSLITFELSYFTKENEKEIKVVNYEIKKGKMENEFKFPIFSKKIYVEFDFKLK